MDPRGWMVGTQIAVLLKNYRVLTELARGFWNRLFSRCIFFSTLVPYFLFKGGVGDIKH